MRRSYFATLIVLSFLFAACSSTPETASKEPEGTPAADPAAVAEPPAATPPASADAAKDDEPVANAPLVAVTSEDEKTIYALGLSMANQLKAFNLSAKELEIVKRALTDSAAGKPFVSIDTYGPKIDPLYRSREAAGSSIEKNRGKDYQAKAAQQKGAQKLPSGLVYRELVAGNGASPVATDNVRVHYKGTLTNGTEFDSSYKRGQPASFPLNGVIPCWTEGVQKMKVGGKAQLVCPSDIAYGDNGRPPTIPGGATLVFEVELLGVN